MTCAVELDPVVAGMPALARPFGNAGDVGLVADEVLRLLQRLRGGARQQARVAGPEAHDGQAAPAAHGRRPSPGTSTMEK